MEMYVAMSYSDSFHFTLEPLKGKYYLYMNISTRSFQSQIPNLRLDPETCRVLRCGQSHY